MNTQTKHQTLATINLNRLIGRPDRLTRNMFVPR